MFNTDSTISIKAFKQTKLMTNDEIKQYEEKVNKRIKQKINNKIRKLKEDG